MDYISTDISLLPIFSFFTIMLVVESQLHLFSGVLGGAGDVVVGGNTPKLDESPAQGYGGARA
jgi:hypothetical protein